jgi:hypothetical protein
VICQYLFVRRDAPGRSLALEVMLNNEAVSNLIRKAKTFQIPSVIASSAESGMQTMDTDLMRLVKAGQISVEDAYVKARSKKEFEEMLAAERQNVVFALPPVSSLLSGRAAPLEPAPPAHPPHPPQPSHSPPQPAHSPPQPAHSPPHAAHSPPPPAKPVTAPAPVAQPRPPSGHMAAGPPRAPPPAEPAPTALPQIVRARPSTANQLQAPPPRLASAAPPAPPVLAPPVLAKPPMAVGEEHTQPEIQMVEISAHLVVDLPGAGDEEAKQAWARFVDAQDKAAAGPATLEALEAVITRHPRCATAHYFCGQVYLFNGDEPNARAWFERTLMVDAQHGPAQQRLAAMRS